MERVTTLEKAYEIMGDNIIGPLELESLNKDISFLNDIFFAIDKVRFIPFSNDLLIENKETHLLVLVVPEHYTKVKLKFEHFRNHFGIDSTIKEPCFYNQDWYLNEDFYKESTLEFKWVLVQKSISEQSRGIEPNCFRKQDFKINTALTYTYIFFMYYLSKNKILWQNDYLWCCDLDSNKDQIYVGRYIDSNKINKNGFSIHRHLKIKNNYGVANFF